MKKIVNGYKVIKKHPFSGIISAFLMLILIALPVLTMFLPIFSVGDPNGLFATGAKMVDFNAFDIFNGIMMQMGVIPKQGPIWLLMTTVPTKEFAQVAMWIVMAMGLILVIIAIFSIFIFVYSLIWMFAGKHESYFTPTKIAIAGFIFHTLYFGAAIAGMIIYDKVYEGALGVNNVVVDPKWAIVSLGASLAILIACATIYVTCYKDRYYIGDVGEPIREDEKIKASGTTLNNPQVQPTQPIPPITVNVTGAGTTQTPVQTVNQVPVSQPTDGVIEHEIVKKESAPNVTIPTGIKHIGGHAFTKNSNLLYANIPNGVDKLGPGAFANCVNLQMVIIPVSVKEIGYNCFYNCISLERITYCGTKEQWSQIIRGSNWLAKSKSNIVSCTNGKIIVNPLK